MGSGAGALLFEIINRGASAHFVGGIPIGDTRPPLGSGYERTNPVMPHRPMVPAGAPGELRLDANKSDIIPEYPY